LLQHTWPGNVRELLSALENALLEADNGVIRPLDLSLPDGPQPFPQPFVNVQSSAYSPLSPAMGAGAGFEANFDPQTAVQAANLSLDAVIHRHVQYVLDLNRGNKLRTARQLQISRSTLYRILANENFLAH